MLPVQTTAWVVWLVLIITTWTQSCAQSSSRSLSNTSSRPRIFVYNLPQEPFRHLGPYGYDLTTSFYGLDLLFLDMLLSSPYITKNPDEADYFYVSAYPYWNRHLPPQTYLDALKQAGPYWERRGGADHIFPASNDVGRCQFPGGLAEFSNATFLLHYGQVRIHRADHCDLLEIWGDKCDDSIIAGEAFVRGEKRPQPGCYVPGVDIVVPPTPYEFIPNHTETKSMLTPFLHDELKRYHTNRTTILFYSGKIDLFKDEPDAAMKPWKDAHYSFGARQTVYDMFHGRPGYAIHTSHTHGDYWKLQSESIFCVAAAGWGWGGRFKTAVTRGCIPVIIQDGIRVEWEEILPMKEYAIRVPTWLVHKLDEILDVFIKTGRVEEMQKVIECVWRFHWWHRPYGRAFELTMCELKRRVLKAHKVQLDWKTCSLECGDGVWVPVKDAVYNV